MPEVKSDLVWLAAAVEGCRDRIDQSVLDQAQAVVGRVDRRLSIAPDVTVVAIAGPTGAGKSSLLNALAGRVASEPGIQRPMTQQALAVTFGSADTAELLDWLGVARRQVTAGADLDGVVLLDLADYDSVITSHRDEVDRLVEVVDEFLWVVDPQKYADAALHDNYLRRLAGHGEVMTFVLNQIDRLTPDQTIEVRRDLTRLLRADGVADPSVLGLSALSGEGVATLRQHLVEVAARKRSMAARLEADIRGQARALQSQIGEADAGSLGKAHLKALTTACLEAVGADQIGEAVRVVVKHRGQAATGWPLFSWISRVKANPLKRLRLDRRRQGEVAPQLTRSSIAIRPEARARIDTAVRSVTTEAGSKLPRLWRDALNHGVARRVKDLPDAIDQAVVSTDLGTEEGHGWWRLVRVLQWLILLVAFAGLIWLAVDFVLTAYLGLPALPTPRFGRLPLPTWLAVGGAVVGLVMAGLSRIAVRAGAVATGRLAQRRLRKSMEAVVTSQLIAPVEAEMRRHDEVRATLARIVG